MVGLEVTLKSIGQTLPRGCQTNGTPDEREVVITLIHPTPRNILSSVPAMKDLGINLGNQIVRDITHTHKWCCESCRQQIFIDYFGAAGG